jgi:CubicO group peptidase (beta-lactamase class C family)
MRRRFSFVALLSGLAIIVATIPRAQADDRTAPDFARITQIVEAAIKDRAFPGCSVAIGNHNQVLLARGYGHFDYDGGPEVTADTLYDLASVTKIVGATSVVMTLVHDGKLSLDDSVSKYVPEFLAAAKDDAENAQRAKVTIAHLMTHSSGLPKWAPLYERASTYGETIKLVIATPLEIEPGTREAYSDLGVMLLGEIAARVGGKPLVELEKEWVFKPIGMHDTMRNPPADLMERIAPTEKKSDGPGYWRGIVHDENARGGEGLTAHAGLFSTANDMARWSAEWLKGARGEIAIFPKPLVEQFTRRQNIVKDSTRALGWDTPPSSQAGKKLSTHAFGHTGFTGTYVYIDPDADLYIVLLTNAVHPKRGNLKVLQIRRAVADAAIDAAAKRPIQLIVHGGEHDRHNVPVTATVEMPASAKAFDELELMLPDGKTIPAELTEVGICTGERGSPNRREIHFILPEIKTGQTLSLKGRFSSMDSGSSSAPRFYWHDVPQEHNLLSYVDRPVLDYMCRPLDESLKPKHDETFKPYHHLYDPDGKILVTKGPGGLYPHHRAMFYGYNKVSYNGKTADVWHCTNGCYQSHEKLLDEEAGPVLGRHCVAVDWHGQDRAPFAHEQREMTVYSLPGGTIVDFASHLETAGGEVHLDGDPQHSGFHFRASQEVAEKTNNETIFIRTNGPAAPGDTINWDPKVKTNDPMTINQPWKGMSFVLGGQRYTAAMLDLPTNPKEARFSERNYGRFGSYFVYDLDKGHPLDIRYRVWLQKGQMTPDQVAALAADFIEPVACEAHVTP